MNQPVIFTVLSKYLSPVVKTRRGQVRSSIECLLFSFILKSWGRKPKLCFIIAKVHAHRRTKQNRRSHSHGGQREEERLKEEAHANSPTYHECTLHPKSLLLAAVETVFEARLLP